MEYISERIVNLAELEQLLSSAGCKAELLCNELKKASPSMDQINGLAEQLHTNLHRAKNFEFCLERRKITDLD